MRIVSISLSIICLNSISYAFSLIPLQRLPQRIRNNNVWISHSTATPQTASDNNNEAQRPTTSNNNSNSGILKELSNGKQLNSNTDQLEGDKTKVIDFGSVQNHSSEGEIALRKAKELHIVKEQEAVASSDLLLGKKQGRLMGINDMVVKEVGREIGDFASDQTLLVQECADYLRSQVRANTFFPPTATVTSIISNKKESASEYTSLLNEAYVESGLVTEAFAKTFYLGTQLLPEDAQRAIWAVYVWCRRTDEIVDAERDVGTDEENNAAMLQDLSAWEYRLERLWEYGEIVDVMDLPLLDTRIRYPSMSIQPFLDMVRGMLMDIPGLGQEKYDSFDELHLYCYRVAGTVGLMSLPVFGCAAGVTEDIAKEPALSLGVALQLTNILRDVGEDSKDRNRIYLPQDDMAKFGITEAQIHSQQITPAYRAFMKYQIARARNYYQKALSGVPMLSDTGRLPVQISLDCYSKILDKIEENDYDNLSKRAYLTKQEKLFEIPFSWYRTQEISKFLPLFGDEKVVVHDLEALEKKLLAERS